MQVDLAGGRPLAVVTGLQPVFVASEGPFRNDVAGPVIEAVNELLESCRRSHVPVVHSRYVLRDDLSDAGLLGAGGWLPRALRNGVDAVHRGYAGASSPLAASDPRVHVGPGDIDSTHNRPSAFAGSDLDEIIAATGADRMILAGVSVNNAITATAHDAFARDIPVVIVREATGAAPWEPPEELDAYFRALDNWAAEVASLSDLVERLPVA